MDKASSPPWKAQWVWHACEQPDRPNTYVYFRREFDLSGPLSEATLRVSADTYYRLFLNGELIGWGPAITEPRWKTFDTYSVGPRLRSGCNVLGAIVYHYGNGPDNPEGNTFQWSRGGFLCQLDLPSGHDPVLSDPSWRVLESAAWRREVPKIDRMTFSEMFDARREPYGWLDPDFDPADWGRAVAVTLDPRVAQWNWNPHPAAVMPWMHLDERPIPPFVTEEVGPPRVLYAGEILQRAEPEGTDDLAIRMSLEQPLPAQHTRIEHRDGAVEEGLLQPDKGPLMVYPMRDDFSYDDFPGMHDPCLGLDSGQMINGRVRIELSAPAGALIDIGYSQILVEGRVVPYLSQRTPLADQYITREGRQVIETFNWRNFRYVQLTLRKMTAPITIHSVRMIAERYPFDRIGSFECSDEQLNWVWKACIDTAELCTHDRLMDNPVRERREYSGDLLCLPLGIYAAFGSTKIVRKYFDDMRRARFNWGVVPHTVMGNRHEVFSLLLDSQLQLINNIWLNYELFGDPTMLSDFYPILRDGLDLAEKYIDERGLLGPSPFTMFVDWADLDRRGSTLIGNLLYAQALGTMADMAAKLGCDDESGSFREKHEKLKILLPQLYWDPQRGVFSDALIDGERSDHTSEHVNFLMMLYGMATPEQSRSIANTLQEPDTSIGQVEPSFIWATEGLFENGYAQWAIDLIRRRYDRLRRQGLETVAELWHLLGERYTGRWRSRDSRSAVQGSGVSAAYLLSRYTLGVQPGAPGFAEALIAPKLVDLDWARGVWPSPKGPIEIDWRREGEQSFSITVRLPDSVAGQFIPPAEFAEGCTWTVNDQPAPLSPQGHLAIEGEVTLVGRRTQ